MSSRAEELSEDQWQILEPLLPELPRREDGKGRPWRSNREEMNGILWVLRSGARWKDLPSRFPPYQTCHRLYQQWVREGVLRHVLEALCFGSLGARLTRTWRVGFERVLH